MPETEEVSTVFLGLLRPPFHSNLCCYCCAPAARTICLDARTVHRWLSGKVEIAATVGCEVPVPYCASHYAKALAIQRRISKYRWVTKPTSYAMYVVLIFSLVASLMFLFYPEENMAVGIIPGVMLGLLFPLYWDPLSDLLAEMLLSRCLEPDEHSDLSTHMEAQGRIKGWYTAKIPYTLGLSINHMWQGTTFLGTRICLSNREYARAFTTIFQEREQRAESLEEQFNALYKNDTQYPIKHRQTVVEKEFCIECGAQLWSGSRFCGECGVQQ